MRQGAAWRPQRLSRVSSLILFLSKIFQIVAQIDKAHKEQKQQKRQLGTNCRLLSLNLTSFMMIMTHVGVCWSVCVCLSVCVCGHMSALVCVELSLGLRLCLIFNLAAQCRRLSRAQMFTQKFTSFSFHSSPFPLCYLHRLSGFTFMGIIAWHKCAHCACACPCRILCGNLC